MTQGQFTTQPCFRSRDRPWPISLRMVHLYLLYRNLLIIQKFYEWECCTFWKSDEWTFTLEDGVVWRRQWEFLGWGEGVGVGGANQSQSTQRKPLTNPKHLYGDSLVLSKSDNPDFSLGFKHPFSNVAGKFTRSESAAFNFSFVF